MTRFQHVLGSNLGRDNGYSGVLRRSPQSLSAKSGAAPRLGQERFFPDPFHLIYYLPSYYSAVKSLGTDNPQKATLTGKVVPVLN
jgi:hypothetical protein